MFFSPKTSADGLVFNYDTGNTVRSYLGEPTSNLHPNSEDVSSWTGNLFGNWIQSAVTSNSVVAPDGTLTGDRVGDGYGRFNVSATATPSQAYTYSVYLKNVSLANNFYIVYAWGLNGSLVSYGNALLINVGTLSTLEWTRFTFTLTAPSSGINQMQFGPSPFTGYGNPSGQQIDVWGGMIEQKSHVTPYTAGTRSATQGLKDLTAKSTIDISTVSFDSNAQITFDGTDDLIDVTTNLGTLSAYTFEYVSYSNSAGNMPLSSRTSTAFYKYGAYSWRYTHGGVGGEFYHTYGSDTGWAHWVITYDGATIKVYENNISKGTSASSGTADFTGGIRIGSWTSSASYTWDGTISIIKMYSRALTTDEVARNFNAVRGRYGI